MFCVNFIKNGLQQVVVKRKSVHKNCLHKNLNMCVYRIKWTFI